MLEQGHRRSTKELTAEDIDTENLEQMESVADERIVSEMESIDSSSIRGWSVSLWSRKDRLRARPGN